MRKFPLTLAVILVAASSVQADILTDNVSFDGIQDVLEDNSRGLLFDEDGSGFVSAGDIIVGLARIDRRSQNETGSTLDDDKQLIFGYSFQVDQVVSFGPAVGITYRPVNPTAGTGLSIKELLGSTLQPALSDAQWAQATFALMEKQFPAVDGSNNPVNNTTTAGLSVVDSVMGNSSGYSLDVIGGLVNGDDFFTNLIIGGPGTNIAAIRASSNAVTLGLASGGFTNLYNNLPAGSTLLPVEADNVLTNSPTFHDFSMTGGNIFGYSTGPGPKNWDYSDKIDVNLNITAVPESASLALFGGAVVGLVAIRRRNVVK